MHSESSSSQLNNHISALVIFGNQVPRKGKWWWKQFNTVIASESLQREIVDRGFSFVSLETMLLGGSIPEAAELLSKVAYVKSYDGSRIAKSVIWMGYELWWIHYDELMYKFCVPYTQYKKLLSYLQDFSCVYFFHSPAEELFRHYLDAHGIKYSSLDNSSSKFPPLGILLQVLLSAPFFIWLILRRPKLLVWTSDLFDPPRDHDFRMIYVYQALKQKKVKFVEFIRSHEPAKVILRHAWVRCRPVIYSNAISDFLWRISSWFGLKSIKRPVELSADERFSFNLATHYVKNVRGDIWAIQFTKFLLQAIGVKRAIIPVGNHRTFHYVLACKVAGIPITGILHGAASRSYVVNDFMPEFDGHKSLSVDKYGLWSEGWKEYFLKYSKVYKPEQLYVSGPMRPMQKKEILVPVPENSGKVKVLFMSEQLASPQEILPYLETMLDEESVDLYIKFRSYRDGFEDWLKNFRPDVLERLSVHRIERDSMNEAIEKCDVVVGSHTTGVLEAVLLLRPFVFFDTKKWGDYFELASYDGGTFFAKDPAHLVKRVLESKEVSPQSILNLRERFFGDPYKNGSQWVVEEAIKGL